MQLPIGTNLEQHGRFSYQGPANSSVLLVVLYISVCLKCQMFKPSCKKKTNLLSGFWAFLTFTKFCIHKTCTADLRMRDFTVYRPFTVIVWALCPYLPVAGQFSCLFLIRELSCKSEVGELKKIAQKLICAGTEEYS